MEIPFDDASESLFELLVGHGIAEGIDGTIGVAQEVSKHINLEIEFTVILNLNKVICHRKLLAVE